MNGGGENDRNSLKSLAIKRAHESARALGFAPPYRRRGKCPMKEPISRKRIQQARMSSNSSTCVL